MAGISSRGSLRDFNYVDDNAEVWAVRLDESNTELVNLAAQTGVCVATNRLPQNIKLRQVFLTNEDGTVKRSAVVLTLARYGAINGTTPFELSAQDSNATTAMRIERKVPEKRTLLPKSFDTGLNDGDQP